MRPAKSLRAQLEDLADNSNLSKWEKKFVSDMMFRHQQGLPITTKMQTQVADMLLKLAEAA